MQDFHSFEVIIVSDGSEDGTNEYLKAVDNPRLLFVIQDQRGPAAARNAGIQKAVGIYIAFTDDDCLVPPDWLIGFQQVFSKSGGDVIGGKVENVLKDNIYSDVSQGLINYLVETSKEKNHAIPFLTSNNLAMKKRIMGNVISFDERFRKAGGEERALLLKLCAKGARIQYSSGITVSHQHEMNLTQFIRQHFHYGEGSCMLYRFVARETNLPISPLPISRYADFVVKMFSEHGLMGIMRFLIFLLGQTSVLSGYFFGWFKHLTLNSKS